MGIETQPSLELFYGAHFFVRASFHHSVLKTTNLWDFHHTSGYKCSTDLHCHWQNSSFWSVHSSFTICALYYILERTNHYRNLFLIQLDYFLLCSTSDSIILSCSVLCLWGKCDCHPQCIFLQAMKPLHAKCRMLRLFS